MTGSVGAAVVTAAVAVLVAVLTQVESWRRAGSDRAYERRRQALIDVQEAALVLRDELREYGASLPRPAARLSDVAGPLEPPGAAVDVLPLGRLERARGRVDVCGVRLEPQAGSRAVARALDAWQSQADEHFLSPSDATAGSERDAWFELNLLVGTALHE